MQQPRKLKCVHLETCKQRHSIKLVTPEHIDPEGEAFTHGMNGLPPLMNFSCNSRGKYYATELPEEHRSLVYVTKKQKFVMAVKYYDDINIAKETANKYGDVTIDKDYPHFRHIRILASVPLDKSPTLKDVLKGAGLLWVPNQMTIRFVTEEDYEALYRQIPWEGPDALYESKKR